MGVLGLTRFISVNSPNAITERRLEDYAGKKIAIDASLCMYQFMASLRWDLMLDYENKSISHVMGTFFYNIDLLQKGIFPVYIFDGRPPVLKKPELEKREQRRQEVRDKIEVAKKGGDEHRVRILKRRTNKITRDIVKDCKIMLTLMGIPYIHAPCEAEAQGAELVKAGLVHAVASEDMDTIAFGSTIFLKWFTFINNRTYPVLEYRLEKVLEGLGLNLHEFVDLSILLGCDYCEKIKGIGPHHALHFIRTFRNIEAILQRINESDINLSHFALPQNFDYMQARRLFLSPNVYKASTVSINWFYPNMEGIVKFLTEKNVDEDLIKTGTKDLLNAVNSVPYRSILLTNRSSYPRRWSPRRRAYTTWKSTAWKMTYVET